jgi:hypothetical protein
MVVGVQIEHWWPLWSGWAAKSMSHGATSTRSCSTVLHVENRTKVKTNVCRLDFFSSSFHGAHLQHFIHVQCLAQALFSGEEVLGMKKLAWLSQHQNQFLLYICIILAADIDCLPGESSHNCMWKQNFGVTFRSLIKRGQQPVSILLLSLVPGFGKQ